MIAVERKRTERSAEPFLLMLLESGKQQRLEKNEKALINILSVMPSSIRDTDIIGWYRDSTTVGVMFTGIALKDKSSILSLILSKVSTFHVLRDQLPARPSQSDWHFLPLTFPMTGIMTMAPDAQAIRPYIRIYRGRTPVKAPRCA